MIKNRSYRRSAIIFVGIPSLFILGLLSMLFSIPVYIIDYIKLEWKEQAAWVKDNWK